MSEPRIPNLFIIGAPKCGTTAMSHYLAGHPDIFMSEQAGVKEPFFYCRDLALSHITWKISKWQDYAQIFDAAPSSVTYIGEASPLYLISREAVPAILSSCPDARFVVMLRNPVELAASFHNQHAKYGIDVADFEAAWRLQDERRRGRRLPSAFSDGTLLQYGEVAKLGRQMERLFAVVEKRRVHCILYEDFSLSPRESYRGLLEFLQLSDDQRGEFPRMNASVTYRWRWLEKNLKRIRRVRIRLGLPGGLGVHAVINRFNENPGRAPLRPEFERELYNYFSNDLSLLAELTGRDLSAWRKPL